MWQPAVLPGFGPEADRYLDRNGFRLHYLDSGGDGRPVILLHGINQNLRTWELVLPHIRGTYRFLAVDHRGHGLSDQPAVAYRQGDLVRDAHALVEALNLRRPAIVGHSLGGWVGLSLAGNFPGLLGGVVAGDIAPNVGAEMNPATKEGMAAALAPSTGDATWADEADAYGALRQLGPTEGEAEVRARMRQQLRRRPDGRLARARSPEIARAILEEVNAVDLWPVLPEIRCPVLVVRAEYSDILSPEVAQRMVTTIPSARLAEVKGSYHNMQLFKPREFGEEVDQFLRGLP